MNKLKISKKNILKESEDPKDYISIKGYDFSKGFNLDKFLDSYLTTGFQATHLKIAIDIIKKMRKDDVTIFLGYTSNMVSSGLRDVIVYLVKNKLVHVLCTTAGGIEEDIIKCLKPFVLGEFRVDDRELRKKGINRIGNIFVPNNRYIEYEKFLLPFLQKMYERQVKEKRIIGTSEFIYELGKQVNDESSILYWASKNNIPIFCPALTDGSTGDMIYFFRQQNKDFKLDIVDDTVKINNIALDAKETGMIALGGSLSKHYVLNANLFRGGAKYAVYVSTGTEGSGSLGGAKPEEAFSWGKLSGKDAKEKRTVMVEGDATIIFPLLVAGAFQS